MPARANVTLRYC